MVLPASRLAGIDGSEERRMAYGEDRVSSLNNAALLEIRTP